MMRKIRRLECCWNVNQNLNHKRRKHLKFSLQKKCKNLIYNVPAEVGQLFGGKLEKRIEAISTSNNALRKHSFSLPVDTSHITSIHLILIQKTTMPHLQQTWIQEEGAELQA